MSASYKDFSLIDAGRLYGCVRRNGALIPRYAAEFVIEKFSLVNSTALCAGPDGYIYYVSGAGNVYYTDESGESEYVTAGFAPPVYMVALHDENAIMVLSGDVCSRVDTAGGLPERVQAPPVTKPVYHRARLFGVDLEDGFCVRWSQARNSFGWEYGLNGAGYIRLRGTRGPILKLVSGADRLYVVCKYGLYALNIGGSPEDFSAELIWCATDEIYGETAAYCGDRLVFYAATGLYSYAGGRLTRLCEEQLADFSQPGMAVAQGGEYFISGKCGGQDVIACVDIADKSVTYLALSCDLMCTGQSVIIHHARNIYRIVSGSGGSWQSGITDFGSSAVKYLQSITIDGVAVKLTVSNGVTERVFENVSGRVKTDMKGRQFTFTAEFSGVVRAITARYCLRG